MAVLASIKAVRTPSSEGGDGGDPNAPKTIKTSIDVGKTLALMVLAIVVFVLAAWMWRDDNNEAAIAFLTVGEAILFGGFGIQIGEQSGAQTAAAELKS